MPSRNRQWILKSGPHGMVSVDNFEYREVDVATADLKRGDILARNLYLSFDPAMRGWIEDAPSYLPPVALNEPMLASSVKMQSFIMFDFMQDIEQAIADLGSWAGAGKIAWKEAIQQGFDTTPATLVCRSERWQAVA